MSEDARESLEVDVLFVGAGPSNLAAAYRLGQLVREHNARGESQLEPMIVMIEKSADVGQHVLSGAVLDPRALEELVPGFRSEGAPFGTPVTEDHLWYLTRNGGFDAPFVPAPLRNEGKFVVSVNEIARWLAAKVVDQGVQIFPGFAGASMLYDDHRRVVGVRTGDKGIDKNGRRKPNFEPGIDIRANVTVLGEGARGSLCKQMFAELGMHGAHPQVYAIGVKELWEIPEGRLQPGAVIHSMGWPLRAEEFGGGFLYQLSATELIVGLVIGLDYRDPFLDAHARLQEMKHHPRIARLLAGGKLLKYGAATIPEGGYYAMPQLFHDGVLVVGDSAGMLNGMRLKGIHLGMKSGMLAAETAFDALLKQDASRTVLSGYRDRFERSWAREELFASRNFHQAFQGGFYAGMLHTGLQLLTGGRGVKDPWYAPAGHEHMQTVQEYYGAEYVPVGRDDARGVQRPTRRFDGVLSFDKLTSVYHADTGHEEDQPCHLVVRDLDLCHDRCTREYGNPCQHFCPASVYEWLPGEGDGRQRFQINASNCVHCKTCDIMDPYQVIDWITPEGGGGPNYTRM